MLQRVATIVVCLLTHTASIAARADVYELKDGGEVVGATVARTDDGRYTIRTAEGAEVLLDRQLVQRIVPQDEAATEYLRRSRTAPDTADAHRDLAEWCRQRKMTDEADV